MQSHILSKHYSVSMACNNTTTIAIKSQDYSIYKTKCAVFCSSKRDELLEGDNNFSRGNYLAVLFYSPMCL